MSTFTPTTIMRVAMIIRRLRDARVRNTLTRDFAKLLHAEGYQLAEAELYRLCRFSVCVALDIPHRYELSRCKVCHDGRPE